MSNTVTANLFRKKKATLLRHGGQAAAVAHMAFGIGGHGTDLRPLPADPDAAGLRNEVLRKPLLLVTQEDDYSVTAKGRIEKNELVGAYISEAMLVDSAGDPVGFKTFAAKIKESDEAYEVSIKVRF